MSRLLAKNVKPNLSTRHFLAVAEQAARAGGRVLLDLLGRAQVYEKGPKDLVTEADRISQSVIRDILLGAFPDHEFIGEEDATPTWHDARDSTVEPSEAPLRWVVDPLDGTANYVHSLTGFAVSIAVEQGGEVLAGVVYDPSAEECYSAVRGGGANLNGKPVRVSGCQQLQDAMIAASFPANVERDAPEIQAFIEVLLAAQSLRRLGSAALNLSYVAAGRMDAYWATSVKPWDVAAGVLLVQEAGGVMTGVEGADFKLWYPKFVAAASPQLHAQVRELLGSIKGL